MCLLYTRVFQYVGNVPLLSLMQDLAVARDVLEDCAVHHDIGQMVCLLVKYIHYNGCDWLVRMLIMCFDAIEQSRRPAGHTACH